MTRYFNVNKVYFNGFTNDSVKNIVNSVNLNNVYFVDNNANSFFNNIPTLTSVTNISYNVTDLTNTFYNCQNLTTIPNIPNTVTELHNTFTYCTNLTNVIFEENSAVVNMQNAFYNCTNLQEAVIPQNAVNIYGAFRSCNNITSAPAIPNSVTDMADAFHYCINLVETPTVPNGVENLQLTFSGTGIINPPVIPNSIINMASTFHKCYNLTSAPNIPANVEWMSYTFSQCQNLSGDIKIESEKVKDAGSCFNNTVKAKDVYIPYEYMEPGESDEKGISGTIVGTLTNTNYAISGFSTSNYIKGSYRLDASQDFEIGCKCTVDYIPSNYAPVYGYVDGGNRIFLGRDNNGYAHFNLGDGNGTWGNGPHETQLYMQQGHSYYLKGVKSGSTLTVYISEDNETWYSASTTNNYSSTFNFDLGLEYNNNTPWCGTIYLEDCYLKINNQTVWTGVRYLPNYDINCITVGTLNDNIGIVSGFSTSNYLKHSGFLLSSPDFEIVFKFKNNSTANPSWNPIFDSIARNSGNGLLIWTSQYYTNVISAACEMQINSTQYHVHTPSDFNVLPNTWYYLKVKLTSSELQLTISENEDFSDSVTVSTPTNGNYYSTNSDIWFGKEQLWGSNFYFDGYLDMNKSYIKINNKLWWTGLKYKNTNTYKAFESEYPPEIEGTISGTLTNDNGIISGFSGSSRVIMSTPLAPNGNPWELIIKAKVNSNFRDTWNSLFGREEMSGGMNLHISSGGTIKNEWSSNGSSWNIGSITGNTVLTVDKWYWVKTGWTGTQYYLSLSEDGINYTSQGTRSSTTPMYNAPNPQYIGNHYGDGTWKYFRGTIDLNETYFTINNIIYWNGTYDLFKADYRKATFNGTNHGTLINNEAILSNFGETNYFILPEPFNTSTANTWEMKYKVVFKNNSVRLTGARDNTTVAQIVIGVDDTTHKLIWWLSSNGAGWNIATSESGQGTTTLIDGQTYYIKATFDGSKYQCYLSTDDINYILQLNINSSTKLFNNNSEFFIGNAELWGNWGDGTIDLKECYIKINDQIWWQGSSGYTNNGVLFHDINAIPEIDVTGYEYELDGTESVTLTHYMNQKTIEPWIQPILTSGTSYGVCTDSRNNTSESQEGWRALDGKTSTHFTPTKEAGQWWKWVVPDTLRFTANVSTMTIVGGESYTSTFMIYADENRTIPLVDTEFTIPTNGNTTTVTITHTTETNTIYLYKTASSNWSGISTLTFNNVDKVTYITDITIPGV